MTVAGVCPGCRRAFDWVEIPPGALGVTCPTCQLVVSVPRAVPLMPTRSAPAPAADGMAIVRVEAPAPPTVVTEDGPYRAPGRAFVERRQGDSYEIDFPRVRRGGRVRPAAVVWAVVTTLAAWRDVVSIQTAAICGLPPLVWSLLARRRRRRVRIDATTIKASGVAAIPRGAVTHIFVLGIADGDDARWEVVVRARGRDRVLAVSALRDDADAIASLLATELGMPTWVPTAALPPGR